MFQVPTRPAGHVHVEFKAGRMDWDGRMVPCPCIHSQGTPARHLTPKIIPDQRVSSKLCWIHCEILGVLGTWFFSTKHGGLFSNTYHQHHQGVVSTRICSPSPSKFAQDFNSYTAYFANASEKMWFMIVD